MRANFIALAVGFAFASIGSALPTDDAGLYNFLSRRVVSPDNTCGNAFNGANNSYSCDATTIGPCCSQYGFCGNTTDYCDAGCQAGFGVCTSSGGVTQPSPDDFTCGPANSNKVCSSGLCCSGMGFCGNTTDYCGASCQSAFGDCDPGSAQPGTGGNCGPNFGNKVCANNQCCSMAGYCGVTSDFCADPGNCMIGGFGRCDSDATPAGQTTANVPRPLKGPISYTDDIFDCVQPGVVALSYDDGPFNFTSSLLDILKTYGFKATFFMTGNNNGKGQIDLTAPYPDLIKRMVAEGHQVASHTWSHYSLSNISHDLRMSQMVKNEMAFNNIIGKWPTYMRPPFSDCTKDSGCWDDMVTLGYHRVYFDLDTQDYLNPLPTQVQNSKNIVKAALQDPSATEYLAIQHDIVQQSVANLSSFFFDQIKARGWKGVTVGECLGDAEANWYRSFNETSTISSSTSKTSSATSSSRTSTTTSKVTTTTSSSSKVSTTSISSSTSKPPTTTSSSSTSKTPTPTPTPSKPRCEFQNGNWCGNVASFSTKLGCQKAAVDCYGDGLGCWFGGLFNLAACGQWSVMCAKLSGYCAKCSATGCNNAGFGY